MRIVLDTNVLVSGLLSPFGPPGRIVDLVTSGRVEVLYDDRVVAEYRDVLARPRLRIGAAEAASAIDSLLLGGTLVSAPPIPVMLPDAGDLPFVEVAQAGAASALVTGNARHFVPTRGHFAVPVLSPADFLDLWLTERGTKP